MNLSIPASTFWCLGIIIAAFVACLIFVYKFKKDDTLIKNRRLVESFPTIVSTLGVLGTFFGITMGLVAFDSTDLDNSIPGLLDGLKTAFFTSLAGMIGSMILNGIINRKQDERDGGVSDINQAAGTICKAVEEMSKLNRENIERLAQQMEAQEADRKAFYRTMGAVMDKISKETQPQIAAAVGTLAEQQKSISSAIDSLVILQRSQESTISESLGSMIASIGKLEEATDTQTTAISSVAKSTDEISEYTHHTGEILDILSGMSGTQDEMNEQVQKLKDILDAEVEQIEHSMVKTNDLLERKFNEFTELLKKSNTEALVEVMKNVTAEFQKQMNALINKLIQENFDQLNQSVEKLNQWQQENKEMISSLTRQYKEMSSNFEATSTSLVRVKDDTQALVSEGGKLRQLVDALNEVIINDKKFLEISDHLKQTAELSHTNMEAFNESTTQLNEWVRKQRNFVDAVQVLLAKLEELGKIRDYSEQFWQGTKKSMEEGVGIIKQGSVTLQRSLTDLDRQFYARLNTTLAELDTCIQAMIKGR